MEDLITKKIKIAALRKARRYVSGELAKLKADNDQLNEIARKCDINPPRLTEAHTDTLMNESTLKKLLQGGIIDLTKMMKATEFTSEETKYIKSLLGNSREISKATVMAYEMGLTIKDIARIIEDGAAKFKSKTVKKK